MRLAVIAGTDPEERMGGSEYQAMLIAHGFADAGHQVLFLATQSSANDESSFGKLRKIYLRSWEIVGEHTHHLSLKTTLEAFAPDICYLRSFPDLSSLASICEAIDAQLVSTSCHSSETFPIIWSRYPGDITRHFRSFYAIRKSAIHICNTKSLKKRLQIWYPRHPINTIYNGQPAPPETRLHREPTRQVIWVNNFKPWKRPELFIKLANQLPHYKFVMIGRMANGRFGKRIRRALESSGSNLEYLGPQSMETVNEIISQSDLLVYTSRTREGFGNSYIQAWFRGVPTLSLAYALDGILERENIGRCPRNLLEMRRDVVSLMEDDAARIQMGLRARAYALQYHNLDPLISKYDSLFREVLMDPNNKKTVEVVLE